MLHKHILGVIRAAASVPDAAVSLRKLLPESGIFRHAFEEFIITVDLNDENPSWDIDHVVTKAFQLAETFAALEVAASRLESAQRASVQLDSPSNSGARMQEDRLSMPVPIGTPSAILQNALLPERRAAHKTKDHVVDSTSESKELSVNKKAPRTRKRKQVCQKRTCQKRTCHLCGQVGKPGLPLQACQVCGVQRHRHDCGGKIARCISADGEMAARASAAMLNATSTATGGAATAPSMPAVATRDSAQGKHLATHGGAERAGQGSLVEAPATIVETTALCTLCARLCCCAGGTLMCHPARAAARYRRKIAKKDIPTEACASPMNAKARACSHGRQRRGIGGAENEYNINFEIANSLEGRQASADNSAKNESHSGNSGDMSGKF